MTSKIMSRKAALRLTLVAGLLIAAAVCTALSYVIISNLEYGVGVSTYESIAERALEGAQAITVRKVQGGLTMASIYSYDFPNESQWPVVALKGFIETASNVGSLSLTGSMGFIPFVKPEDVQAFEEHSKQVFVDDGYPNGTGYSDFGFGIWTFDPTATYPDKRKADKTGATFWGSNYTYMAPIAQYSMISHAKMVLFMNLHSNPQRGMTMDSMLDCAAAFASATKDEDSSSSTRHRRPKCGVVTDFVELLDRPGPAAVMYQPIYPANDPTTVVGTIGTTLHWSEVLTDVVPDYVDGLICVISTSTATHTYEIRDGIPTLKGEGDLHDPGYSHLGQSVILNEMETDASFSELYTLTVYPSEKMLTQFSTGSPLAVSTGFLAVILACTAIFLIYDYLMRSEVQERKMILEMKRRFVRFISHEIRTPLNTVCMGLELLRAEFGGHLGTNPMNDLSLRVPATMMGETDGHHDGAVDTDCCEEGLGLLASKEDIEFWNDIACDVQENANSAVNVLNDLLNYDKIESGTLQLEMGIVPIWDLLERTIGQFRIQAVNRQIDLSLELLKYSDSTSDCTPDDEGEQGYEDAEPSLPSSILADTANLHVIGDHIRLTQVLRNVISNALKFTPPDGTIKVTVKYFANGLPNSQLMLLEGEEECSHDRNGSLEVTIKDSGVGLSQEQLQLLFGEGVQFDSNRLQHGGGSGLGLNIAKGLVEQHGGTIRAASEGIGHGTSFILELPLYHVSAEEIKKDVDETHGESLTALSSTYVSEEPQLKANSEAESPRTRRILVAEDAASSRKMMIRLIERAGHQCIPAVNGQEAVDAIRADMAASSENLHHVPIDTVLMDFEMPVLRGPDASQQLRDMGFNGIILGITGNVLKEDVDYFKHHGADEVLPKPVSMDAMQNAWNDRRNRQH